MALAYLLDPNQQYIANGGVPNVGGFIEVYLNGTDDPAVTYSDFEGTANPFPVVLDSNGRAVVIADESKAYRVEVYGALGNLLWTSYPVVPRTYTQNNFTNADKEKLDGIEEGAQKNVQADWAQTDSLADDFIKNKPDLDQYAEKDELAHVAFSGDYNDLENLPSIPPAQVQSDWNQANVSDPSYIRNKPDLAAVATSGNYNDLDNQPVIPPPQVPADWNSNAGVTEILNKPDITGMAQTTADALCELKANIEAVENDIPPEQVQADYAQADPNAVDFIRNKPDLSLKEDKSNKAETTVDPTSTTQYPSSKAMADYAQNLVTSNSGKYISDDGNPFPSASDLPTAPAIVSHNDYAVVLTGGIYYRYKATVVGGVVSWAMEYAINTNAFTPEQQAAIDSTITAVKVGNYDAHIANTTIHVTQNDKNTWNGKQNSIADLGAIRSGAQAGATAVQPAELAEQAQIAAAALVELKEGVQAVEEDIPEAQVQADWNESNPFAPDYIKNKPDNLVQDASYVHTDNNFTTALKDKLDGIESGAQVNVKADWDEADPTSDSYIENKPSLATVATSGDYNDLDNLPTIPPAQVQSDWDQSDNTHPDYIKNKPTIPEGVPAYTSSDKYKVLSVNSNGDNTQWRDVREVPSYASVNQGYLLGVVNNGGHVELGWTQPIGYWTQSVDLSGNHTLTAEDIAAGYVDFETTITASDTSSVILNPTYAALSWDVQVNSGPTANTVSSVDFALGISGGSYDTIFSDNNPAHEVHKDWGITRAWLLNHRKNRVRARCNLASGAVVGDTVFMYGGGIVMQVR